MKEKLLVTRIGDQMLLNAVIYGHEIKQIDVMPYGNVWTKEYLDSLQEKLAKNKDNKSYKNKPNFDEIKNSESEFELINEDVYEYVMLGYQLVSIEDVENNTQKPISQVKFKEISKIATYARIQKITKKSGGIYTLTLVGIGRHFIEKALDANGENAKNITDIESVITHKYSYDASVEDLGNASILLTQIDEAATVLAQSSIWDTIQMQLINNPYYDASVNNKLPSKNDFIDPNGANVVDIISSLLYFTYANNWIKLDIFERRNIVEQIRLIIDHIRSFYFLSEWSPKQTQVFKSLEIFDGIVGEAIEEVKTKKHRKDNSDVISDAIIENEINKKVKDNLDKQQREFLLKEKLRAIKESLQENDQDADDESEYTKIIKDKNKSKMYPESVQKLIKSETNKMKSMMSGTPDANITSSYINVLKSLPWRKIEVESLDISKAREILDKNHYGLGEVKERIIEYLSLIINHKTRALKSKEKSLLDFDKDSQIDLDLFKETGENSNKVQKNFNNVPILTLVGPPGTGKTSLARAIAEALNKSYIKISLGGVHDESEIRGHRRTYVGAMPGKIIKAIQKTGVSNPLILLDEIDKMSSDYKGDPSSAMLEVLDPEQNTKFQDNYLEHEYDLSKVMFIATANYYENIPAPLLDRVEILELNSYTTNEKIKIAKEHLVDTAARQAGLSKEQFKIEDDVIEVIIKNYTAEAGVRSLKRQLDKIARKIVAKIVAGEDIKEFNIDKETAIKLLGTPKYGDEDDYKKPQVGVVNGLAYTSIGGSTLQIEVSSYPAQKGGFKLTGSLKDVMKESAAIAYSYVRSNAKKFGIEFDFENNELHIHVPEGAVPKDGPSAGITFTTALVSALTNKPVSHEVAMTGEITLRGNVLPIGGLKEKSFAAFKKGVKTVFIPKQNQKNLNDIPDEVKQAIEFIPVSSYDEVFEKLFKRG